MKNSILPILLVTAVVQFSCDPDNPSSPGPERTCFTVLDEMTGLPVDSATVALVLNGNRRYGTTGPDGRCCIEHEAGEIKESMAWGSSYVWQWTRGLLPAVIRLTPSAFLRIRVTNVPPVDQGDLIGVSFPNESLSGGSLVLFYGIVDTTFTTGAPPWSREVSWRSWHEGIPKDSSCTFVLKSRDTMSIQILY